MKTTHSQNWGGKRPGSGRKPALITVRLSPATAAQLRELHPDAESLEDAISALISAAQADLPTVPDPAILPGVGRQASATPPGLT